MQPWLRRSFLIPVLFSLHCGPREQPAPVPDSSVVMTSELGRILNDDQVWGEHLPAVLVRLRSWSAIGEDTLALFPDRAQSQKPIADDTTRRVQQLNAALRDVRGTPTRAYAPLFARAAAQVAPLQAGTILFYEDEQRHLTLAGPLRLLRSGVRVDEIRSRHGPPESVRKVVVDTEGERRPAVLTYYVYADGAVIFVETDLAPRPGVVDRVLIDIPAVSRQLFQEEAR